VAAAEEAARTLEGLGHSVEPAELDFDFDALAAFITAINGSFTQDGIDWDKVEPHNKVSYQRGLETNSIDYLKAIAVLQKWSRTVVSRWGRDFDVLLSPTMAIEPPPAGQILSEVKTDPDNPSPTVFGMVAFTAIFNLTGLPAVSLPTHQAPSGLPVGVQLVERPFNESGLLRLASQVEAALPWRDRHPAL
jgi:amidase